MEQPTATNIGPSPGSDDEDPPQHRNENGQGGTPTRLAAAAAPMSLSERAPAESIATRIWEIYVGLGLASVQYENRLEQRVQCIRSQLLQHSIKLHASAPHPSLDISARIELTKPRDPGFPYPNPFRRAIGRRAARWVRTGNVHISSGPVDGRIMMELPTTTTRQVGVEQEPRPGALGMDVDAGGGDSSRRTVLNTATREVGVGVSYFGVGFGVIRRLVTQRKVSIEPMHVIIGIFPPGNPNPRERIMFVHKPEHFFRELHWGAYRLRGLGSTLFSLTRVREFRCNADNGTHERIQLDRNGVMDLQLLLYMYDKWFVDGTTAQVWANWVHQALNDRANDVPNGTYSLELVLGWSATRISVVVLLPVLLSLAVGLYLNSRDWSDLTTIQTAWGTASYVVTTGGLLAALLAILSSIETDSRRGPDK
ncbi:hypothetical protein F5Y14DRAFT_447536 [Nemania sp. NC0429]|nr:hypothetical protein F5Y14DRAFT_447536 [Nemania sp. NC0429]